MQTYRAVASVTCILFLHFLVSHSEDIEVSWYLGVQPASVFAEIGDSVTWVWKDDLPHSVEGIGNARGVFSGKGGDHNLVEESGFKYSHTFNHSGVFPFECGLFGQESMSGFVSVAGRVKELMEVKKPLKRHHKGRGGHHPKGKKRTTASSTLRGKTYLASRTPSPPPKSSTKLSPPPKSSGKHPPPPKVKSPPPKKTSHSPPPKKASHSPPPKKTSHSPPPKKVSHSPPPKKVSHSPPPKKSVAPPPKVATPPPPPTPVTIQWFYGVSLEAASATIKAGTTVNWIWADNLFHAVEDLNFTRNLFDGPGGGFNIEGPPFTYSYKFVTPGSYSYDCSVHGTAMTGVITVTK